MTATDLEKFKTALIGRMLKKLIDVKTVHLYEILRGAAKIDDGKLGRRCT